MHPNQSVAPSPPSWSWQSLQTFSLASHFVSVFVSFLWPVFFCFCCWYPLLLPFSFVLWCGRSLSVWGRSLLGAQHSKLTIACLSCSTVAIEGVVVVVMVGTGGFILSTVQTFPVVFHFKFGWVAMPTCNFDTHTTKWMCGAKTPDSTKLLRTPEKKITN